MSKVPNEPMVIKVPKESVVCGHIQVYFRSSLTPKKVHPVFVLFIYHIEKTVPLCDGNTLSKLRSPFDKTDNPGFKEGWTNDPFRTQLKVKILEF